MKENVLKSHSILQSIRWQPGPVKLHSSISVYSQNKKDTGVGILSSLSNLNVGDVKLLSWEKPILASQQKQLKKLFPLDHHSRHPSRHCRFLQVPPPEQRTGSYTGTVRKRSPKPPGSVSPFQSLLSLPKHWGCESTLVHYLIGAFVLLLPLTYYLF